MPLPSNILAVTLLASRFAHAFDRDACLSKTQELLSQNPALNDSFFFRDTFGGPRYDGPDNMTLTLQGCEAICGPWTWYTDIGPRLTIWLVPILILVANVELSPLDKRRFFALLHLLGDPIDSLWSLLHKLDAWDRCSTLAARCDNVCASCQRVIAAVFAGHEEIQGPRLVSEREFDMLLQQYGQAKHFSEWRRAAVRLADGRTDELGRTVLAFLLYVLQLIAAFVPEVGGASSSPPGGRIATGVLLAWLVPAIMFSNAIGNLPSRRTAYDVMADLAANTSDEGLDIPNRRSVLLPTFSSVARQSSASYFASLGWSGAIYTYRPWKLHYVTSTPHRHLHTLLLGFLATAPVLFGFIGGFLILWYQLPEGLNCRHVWLVGVTLLWFLSATLTWLTYRPGIATGRYHWWLTLVKDACVAIPSLLAMFLSGVGLFNFCWCWSGPFQYPNVGRVPLPEKVYQENAKSKYPTIVGVVLALELAIFVGSMLYWRRGLKLLRWSEATCREEWERAEGGKECKCICISGRPRLSSQVSEISLFKPGAIVVTEEVE